jgi:hypothetical protein
MPKPNNASSSQIRIVPDDDTVIISVLVGCHSDDVDCVVAGNGE